MVAFVVEVADGLAASLVVRVPEAAPDCEPEKDATDGVGTLAEALGEDVCDKLPDRVPSETEARALLLTVGHCDSLPLWEGEGVSGKDS
jgi:hypothetical protein